MDKGKQTVPKPILRCISLGLDNLDIKNQTCQGPTDRF